MKITLKKFSKDPKHLIKKAPIIIVINREPAYAIIPYAIYKNRYGENNLKTQDNTTHQVITSTPQNHSRIWRLFFE